MLRTSSLRRSSKPCKEKGCTSPLYAREWCLHHYKLLYLLPKQRNKPKKIYKIPVRTKKRAEQEEKYFDERKVFIEDQRALDPKKQVYCIFCGKTIKGEPDLHHGLGRDNEKLLRKENWYLAHRWCHKEYHDVPWEKIKWWAGYIIRIMSNFLIYHREKRRMQK